MNSSWMVSVRYVFRLPVFLLPAFLIPVRSSALEYGLNCGAPIIASTGQITGSTNPDVMKATGAQWVRVNFILGPWNSPDDTTARGPQNLTWFQTYDQIIDGYLSRGVQVYGLIGAETVKNATRDQLNTEGFTANLTANAILIMDHYRGRVFVYEIFNEPNDWAGGTSSQVEPYWLARYMESVYRAAKIDNGHKTDPSWQAIRIVTGPLFTHDLDTGGPYLAAVFQAGTQQLQWNTIKTETGTYPYDGIGFHAYVRQGYEPNSEVVTYLERNLDAVWGAVTQLEGPGTQKKIYISEFGWNSAYTSEAVQASKMDTAFTVFERDSRIAQAHWFTLTDWGGNNWGIYRAEPYTEANRKAAYDVFHAHATSGPGTDDASLSAESVPVWFEPGTGVAVSVTAHNIGTTTWAAGSGSDRPVTLSAGSVAGGASADNEFVWSGFGNGGVSDSPTVQSAWLGADVAPGGQASFSFTATGPTSFPRGPKRFVARMMRTPGGGFGSLLSLTPLVVARSESMAEDGSFESGVTDWTAFGQTDGVQSGTWFAGISASEGTHFFGAAANYGTKNGGCYQRIAAAPGGWYGAVVQVRTYREGGAAGDAACRIGLDPAGGTDPGSAAVQWSAWTESQGAWSRIAANAVATGSQITIFLQMHQAAPVWNVTALDDVIVGGPAAPSSRVPMSILIY